MVSQFSEGMLIRYRVWDTLTWLCWLYVAATDLLASSDRNSLESLVLASKNTASGNNWGQMKI